MLNDDEIGVSKPFGVIENGNHLRRYAVNRNFLRFRRRERRVLGISGYKQIHGLRHFARIGDRLRPDMRESGVKGSRG